MVTANVVATLLDIGIGTGSLAALFEKRVSEVTGVDVSEQMLVQCEATHGDFRLEEGSFTEILFPDAAFDIVVSSITFHEVDLGKRFVACSAVARVARPDAQIVILDVMFPSEPAVDEACQSIGSSWDPDEEYRILDQRDVQLRGNGFANLRWRQSAPYHWIVVARRQTRKGRMSIVFQDTRTPPVGDGWGRVLG
jgi:SAM-dependent methyltransferase